jgi:K+-transporting ATPase ATPase A chain
LLFNLLGGILTFLILTVQNVLIANPEQMKNVPSLLAFNTAVSFMTNTNWQAYAGETTLSHFTQMFVLSVQNFLSVATAIAVVLVLARGFIRQTTATIGNVWSDLTKSTLYILLPLSVLIALILMQQGVVQNFSPYTHATTLEGMQQIIPSGPVASQEAIKMLGTNGGGFFNANSAHPFENPTPLTNFIEILAIFLIPAALTYAFGKLIGATKQGWVLFLAMMIIFCIGLGFALYAEHMYNPFLNVSGCMEGKEVRFGINGSVLFSMTTTAASCGAVNCMHESLSPISGLIAMFNMMTGEVIFGGVGSGFYGMVLYAIVAVFIAGLMVGRTPEYLGKKIDAFEIKMSVIGILASPMILLLFAAVASSTKAGSASLTAQGIIGLNEILYGFASVANNNGSAFGSLNASTPFYLVITSIAMLAGRFATMIVVMAISGKLAMKKMQPISSGTFPTGGILFLTLLIGTVLIVGALNFFPVLSIGPILEHLLMMSGKGL